MVTFQPSGVSATAQPEEDILSVARTAGVEIESACGGKGVCGKCKVRLQSAAGAAMAGRSTTGSAGDDPLAGVVTPPTRAEEDKLGAEALADGWRLACQTRVSGPVRVFVPEESRRVVQVVRKEAGQRTVPLDAAVKRYRVTLTPPTLHDAEADADRLLAALEAQKGLSDLSFDLRVLQALPGVARSAGWDLSVIVWRSPPHRPVIVEVRPGADPGRMLGLAVDVGTTTIAAHLVDLTSGEIAATESAMNPQVAFGDDVIARLHHASSGLEARKELQNTVIAAIADLGRKAVARCGATVDDVFDVVLVGNTAIHHLFLGLDPRYLGAAPFTPAVRSAIDTTASALGLPFHPGCRLHVLPVEAGFVGADNVAVLIAEEPYEQDDVLLVVDIGTNGELVLGNRHRMLSASCATGPALEGAHIESGMRAAPGAIERVRIDPQTLEVRFKVIGRDDWHTEYAPGDVGARGICGSGIIDAAAEMFKAGIILPGGGFNPDIEHERLLQEDGRPRRFVIARTEETAIGRPVTVSLKDIRAIQLAKAALRAGAEILMRRYEVERPDRVILAGAFGSYIDRQAALTIGMLPPCDPDTVVSVGNSAGDGARFALLNTDKRAEARWVATTVEYVELATDPVFQEEYVKALAFDPAEISQNPAGARAG
ncbi:MAG: DUF4445 domain-containing protein [Thermoleophilia bacterium]|nr:DUF4445 domain-containing protein [Thermoleophilia bacterium]